ncbi:hypothetical protein EPYR_03283 [Erwinia pyrifoliae DSM 12163]|nr:hypothetical protein EPYR_03283 [Erwinia pyrifoliae DSM 12163]
MWRPGMTISAKNVRFDQTTMWVELSDGRVMGVPLAWFPRLLNASVKERSDYELSQRGIHWDALDEDISVDGLLAGRGDVTHIPHHVA